MGLFIKSMLLAAFQFISISHPRTLPDDFSPNATLTGVFNPIDPKPTEQAWPITCIGYTPPALSSVTCIRVVNSISRTADFDDEQFFLPSPYAFTPHHPPSLMPNVLPYHWNSWAGDHTSGGANPHAVARGCSITLTFQNWHAAPSDLWETGSLESVQWAARRIVLHCADKTSGYMPIGITRSGNRGRLLVVVGKGDVLLGHEGYLESALGAVSGNGTDQR